MDGGKNIPANTLRTYPGIFAVSPTRYDTAVDVLFRVVIPGDMHDDPVKAVRHKTDSSLVKGLTMLKSGEADAFVSAGSTGALHVGTV